MLQFSHKNHNERFTGIFSGPELTDSQSVLWLVHAGQFLARSSTCQQVLDLTEKSPRLQPDQCSNSSHQFTCELFKTQFHRLADRLPPSTRFLAVLNDDLTTTTANQSAGHRVRENSTKGKRNTTPEKVRQSSLSPISRTYHCANTP